MAVPLKKNSVEGERERRGWERVRATFKLLWAVRNPEFIREELRHQKRFLEKL